MAVAFPGYTPAHYFAQQPSGIRPPLPHGDMQPPMPAHFGYPPGPDYNSMPVMPPPVPPGPPPRMWNGHIPHAIWNMYTGYPPPPPIGY